MFKVDGKRQDFHRSLGFAFVKIAPCQFRQIKLHCFIERVNDIVHACDPDRQRTIIRHQRGHDLFEHRFDSIPHMKRFTRRVCQSEGRCVERGLIEVAWSRWVESRLAIRQHLDE